jgi:peptidoglycan/xylan/chitin deacetylase (PgdA/CDA1 family)
MRRRGAWIGWLAALALAFILAACGSGADRAASATPTPRAARTPAPRTDLASVAARSHVPVLCYHQLRAPGPGDGPQDRPYIVDPRTFARQMAALDRAGYRTVRAEAVVAHLAKGTPLPPRSVLLTFDDGTAPQYRVALPVLRRHGFTAAFFPMTVALGKPGWLTRRQVRDLDRRGMTIGAHTWDHHAVTEYGEDDWARQIDAPAQELARIIGHPVRMFAYPYGRYTPEAIPHLWQAGLTAAFQLSGEVDPQHPMWSIRRIIVPAWSGDRLLRELRDDF